MAAVTGISHMPGEIPPGIPLPGYRDGKATGGIVRSVGETLFPPEMIEKKTISAADRRGRALLTPAGGGLMITDGRGFHFSPAC